MPARSKCDSGGRGSGRAVMSASVPLLEKDANIQHEFLISLIN